MTTDGMKQDATKTSTQNYKNALSNKVSKYSCSSSSSSNNNKNGTGQSSYKNAITFAIFSSNKKNDWVWKGNGS